MFNFSRRINRLTFAVGYVTSIVVVCLLAVLIDRLTTEGTLLGGLGGVLMLLIIIALVFYWICLVRQRSNDVTGTHAILLFAVSWFTPLILAMMILPGEKLANKYGSIPASGIKLKP
jgi:uncharacterized membrane protein YhaH (DUF805 family)